MSKTLVKILTFSTIAAVVIGGFVAGIILPPDVALTVAVALAVAWFALSLARRSLLSMTSALWTLLALLSVLAGFAGFVLAGVVLAGILLAGFVAFAMLALNRVIDDYYAGR